jgi:hypothetical protein
MCTFREHIADVSHPKTGLVQKDVYHLLELNVTVLACYRSNLKRRFIQEIQVSQSNYLLGFNNRKFFVETGF